MANHYESPQTDSRPLPPLPHQRVSSSTGSFNTCSQSDLSPTTIAPSPILEHGDYYRQRSPTPFDKMSDHSDWLMMSLDNLMSRIKFRHRTSRMLLSWDTSRLGIFQKLQADRLPLGFLLVTLNVMVFGALFCVFYLKPEHPPKVFDAIPGPAYAMLLFNMYLQLIGLFYGGGGTVRNTGLSLHVYCSVLQLTFHLTHGACVCLGLNTNQPKFLLPLYPDALAACCIIVMMITSSARNRHPRFFYIQHLFWYLCLNVAWVFCFGAWHAAYVGLLVAFYIKHAAYEAFLSGKIFSCADKYDFSPNFHYLMLQIERTWKTNALLYFTRIFSNKPTDFWFVMKHVQQYSKCPSTLIKTTVTDMHYELHFLMSNDPHTVKTKYSAQWLQKFFSKLNYCLYHNLDLGCHITAFTENEVLQLKKFNFLLFIERNSSIDSFLAYINYLVCRHLDEKLFTFTRIVRVFYVVEDPVFIQLVETTVKQLQALRVPITVDITFYCMERRDIYGNYSSEAIKMRTKVLPSATTIDIDAILDTYYREICCAFTSSSLDNHISCHGFNHAVHSNVPKYIDEVAKHFG